MNRLLFLLLFSLIFAEGTVSVSVGSKNIIEGDSVILTVKAENTDSAPQVDLSKMNDFNIVSGPSQSSSSSYQYVNGKMTGEKIISITWTLIPKRTGKLVIPSFNYTSEGVKLKSTPIYVNVSKTSKKSTQNRKYFIEATVDKTDLYRGEQVVLTYLLYTKVDITGFDNETPPFQGFWTEEILKPTNLKLQEVVKNGERFHMAIIEKLALFPTKSGEISIDPMVAVVGVREKRRNDFSIFGPPSKNYTISTNPIKLNVKPLPENKFGNVTPVIGSWNISSSVNSTKIKQNEAITYTIKIKGIGNIKSVDIETIEFPGELEVFEPEILVNQTTKGGKIGGDKIIEYVLIPRYSGKIILPEIIFTYFNSTLEKWQTKKTKPINLQVEANEKSSELSLGFSKEEVSLIAEDIRFNDETIPRWKKKENSIINTIAIGFITFAGLFLLLPSFFSKRKAIILATSNERNLRKQFNSAMKALKNISSSNEENYNKIHKVFIQLINVKLNSNKAEYSSTEIINLLSSKIQPIDVNNLTEILNRADAVRFSPVSSDDVQNDISEVKRIVKEVNHAWK